MRLLSLLVVFLVVPSWTAPVVAQPTGDPVPKILEAWKKRQTAFKTVKYVITGKVEVFFLDAPTPDLKAKLPKTPAEYPYRAELLFDVATGRFSLSTKRSVASIADQRFVEESGMLLFDGKRLMSGTSPSALKPTRVSDDVTILTGNLSRSVFDIQLWPVFHAHGIIPTAQKGLSPKRLRQHVADESFDFRGRIRHAGVNSAVIVSEALAALPAISDEFLIDESHSAAVLRQTYFTGKRPMARLDTTWAAQSETWIPSAWTCTWYDGGKVQSKHHLRVESVVLNPLVTDDDFRYPLQPGMTVAESASPEPGIGLDPTRPNVKKYTIGSNGREVVTEESGNTTLDGVRLPPDRSQVWVWWVAGGVVLVLTLGVLLARYVWIRRTSSITP